MNTINFLHEQEANILDQVVQWLLTYGRTVVMITYLIALCAWGYRFTIDYQMSNLHTQLTNNEKIIQYSASQEAQYRNLQNRLHLITSYDQQSHQTVQYIMDLIAATQGNVTYSNLDLEGSSVDAIVVTNSTPGLNQFISTIRNLPYVSEVNINSIENKVSQNQVVADVSIQIQAPAQP